MQAAKTLREQGIKATIVERGELGGKLRDWHCLFPDFTPANEVLAMLPTDFDVVRGEVVSLENGVTLKDGTVLQADAVIIATGFDLFPAERKEELGYGIYNGVVTTADVERMLDEGAFPEDVRRVAFLHCVGSRDEKVDQRHCSKVCCITAVKQAIEVRELVPDCEVWDFYMDMRMFGRGWEELYRRAQEEFQIQFVRGRISEASQTIDGRVQIKAEDTLLGRPLKMTVDMLVLAVGMVLPEDFGLSRRTFTTAADKPGVFFASCSPATIPETLANATRAALDAAAYVGVRV